MHDGGLGSVSPEAKGKIMQASGVNVHPVPFRNPTDLSMSFNNSRSVRSIEAGLTEMRRLFSEGKLKVHCSCSEWLREKNGYFYKRSGNGMVPSGSDHMIDASRLAILSLRGNIGSPYGQSITKGEWLNNGFSYDIQDNGFSY